ncbi:MAG: hypothetical protein AB7E36_13560 [Salinivirgaceae bacterium]
MKLSDNYLTVLNFFASSRLSSSFLAYSQSLLRNGSIGVKVFSVFSSNAGAGGVGFSPLNCRQNRAIKTLNKLSLFNFEPSAGGEKAAYSFNFAS